MKNRIKEKKRENIHSKEPYILFQFQESTKRFFFPMQTDKLRNDVLNDIRKKVFIFFLHLGKFQLTEKFLHWYSILALTQIHATVPLELVPLA